MLVWYQLFWLYWLLQVDLFPTVCKTGEFVISTILTILQKKGGGGHPHSGCAIDNFDYFAKKKEGWGGISPQWVWYRQEQRALREWKDLVKWRRVFWIISTHSLSHSRKLPCNVFYHRITQRGQSRVVMLTLMMADKEHRAPRKPQEMVFLGALPWYIT